MPSPVPHAAEPESAALIAARESAVACDLAPLTVLAIDGPDAASFLQGQLSSDVVALAGDAAQYTSYNSPAGRMLANFILWREGAVGYRALLPADIAESVRKRLAMFVLRSKVKVADVSNTVVCTGVGGPEAAAAVAAALGSAPATMAIAHSADVSVLALPGPRFVVLAPVAAAPALARALSAHAVPAGYAVWQWLTLRAGIPEITAPTQDKFVPQTANWEVLGGINFQKGCYTGQEIIARTQYLGRLKERLHAFHAPEMGASVGDRLYSVAFGDQACGTVINAAPAPGGGCDLVAVLQLAAAATGDVRLRAVDGPRLTPLTLPYAIPAPAEPRGRVAPPPVNV